MRAKPFGVATAAIGLGLAAAACASGGGTAAALSRPTPSATRPSDVGSRASLPPHVFGRGCVMVPASGPGSFGAMAALPVATAVASTPALSELARAIRAAGLIGTLNSAKSLTVLAPDNRAFANLGSGNLSTLMADKADLRKVLEYHLVAGRKTPAGLVKGGKLATLSGISLRTVHSDGLYRINNAHVTCADVQTANATIYIINKVLIP